MLTTVAAGRVYDYSYCIGMYSQAGRGFWAPQDFSAGTERQNVCVEPWSGATRAAGQ